MGLRLQAFGRDANIIYEIIFIGKYELDYPFFSVWYESLYVIIRSDTYRYKFNGRIVGLCGYGSDRYFPESSM